MSGRGASNRPELSSGVFSYAFFAGKKGEMPFNPARPLRFEVWTGPQAPPPPAVAKELKGVDKMLELVSKALGEKRKIKIYLPPGHDRAKSYPVIYAADGMTNAEILEPLILAGKVRPIVVVGVLPGLPGGSSPAVRYQARSSGLRISAGDRPTRFAKHEKFFCEEVRAWAEKELGATRDQSERAIQGVSNGARFAVEMGMRHPELFGHVFGFSVASTTDSKDLAARRSHPGRAGQGATFSARGRKVGSFLSQVDKCPRREAQKRERARRLRLACGRPR